MTSGRRGSRGGSSVLHLTSHVSLVALVGLGASPLAGQVTISPSTTQPAAWERFAVRVFGAGDSNVVGVRVEAPDAVTILGVQAVTGWQYSIQPATDTTPQAVVWTGGSLSGFDFEEFAILGRVMADARPKELVFPVHVGLAGGGMLHFAGSAAAARPAPRVRVVGRTQLSPRGAMAAAAAAFALSAVAIGLTLSRRRSDDPSHGETSQ